ncbi:MAG: TonB-dependent receptor [Acidobacteriota bacterium]|nr:TonB-dependent receptor [Acidobacteriota bacterium]
MKAKSRNAKVLQRKFIFQTFFFNRFIWSLVALMAVSFGQNVFASDAGTIKGTVRATASGQSTFIAGAKLTLTNNATSAQPLRVVSNEAGEFVFSNLPSGDYILIVEAAGLSSVTREIKLDSGAVLTVDIDLAVTVGETVTVRVEEGLLSISETSTVNVIRSETLNTEPFRNDNFQNSIALTPGVVRDGSGNDYLKGSRSGQSGYKVNGVDVTDPITGELAFEIPLEAAAVVEVEENPFSAEFGQFTGGVTNLKTKGGGDKFKVSAARFFPTLRNVFSTKIDSFRPRITVSGALIEKRLFYLQSFEYRFRRDLVPSLAKSDNTTTVEAFNSFSQIDWNVNKNNSLRFNFAVFPSKIRNLNLDTFNPPETSPNYKQRGILAAVSEQSVFKDGSFLSSEISYKTFDVDVFAKSNQPFTITPEVNRGGYFADTRRQTSRWQWREVYFSRPLKFNGQHSIKTGFELFSSRVKGTLNYKPIFIRRRDETLAQRIDFQPGLPLGYSYQEIAAFVQDRWAINPKVTLDFGFRFDRDGVTGRNNISPRFSVLYSPAKNGRTVIRGGIGIFYDRSSGVSGVTEQEISDEISNVSPNFMQIPIRVVTNYAANGTTIIDAPRLYAPQIAEPLRTPQSLRWSVQLDQGITKELTVRFGYLKRTVKNDLLFEPSVGAGNTGAIFLSSRATSRYDEFQFVTTYNKPNFGQWNASYVFSRVQGDLNTADKIYSDTPAFVLRPNEYAPLPFDARHRFLLYGQLDFPHDIRVAPLLEIRSGFPYSAVDASLNFVGGRNQAGRFPMYMSLDFQITKGFKLPFFDNKKARIGVALFNLTNHFNPRDVQNNLTSLNFRKFYNSLGTAIKAKFDIEF